MKAPVHSYRVLGLQPGATREQIKQAYRDLVSVWHPDRFANNPRLRAKAEETLKKINAAYADIIGEAGPRRPSPPPSPKDEARPRPAEHQPGQSSQHRGTAGAPRRPPRERNERGS